MRESKVWGQKQFRQVIPRRHFRYLKIKDAGDPRAASQSNGRKNKDSDKLLSFNAFIFVAHIMGGLVARKVNAFPTKRIKICEYQM